MYIWYISLGMKNYRNLLYEEEPRVLPFIYIPMNLSIFLFFPVHSSTSFQSSGRVKTEITARQKHHVTSRSIPRWNTLTCRLHVCIYIYTYTYIRVSWPSFHCARVPHGEKWAYTGSGKASANVSNIPCEQTLSAATGPASRLDPNETSPRDVASRTQQRSDVYTTWLPGRRG